MYMTTYRPRFGLKPHRHTSLFDDFFTPSTSVYNEVGNGLHPAVDIYEKDEKIIVEAELPGIDKEKIKVDVRGRLLTLSGEHDREEETEEDGGYRRERRFGKFERTFKLPFEITEEHIDASYTNGVLVLKIEKPEEQKPKQITIN
ncbi:MAG: Hsp20/alpha crystallin family protein [Desulfofustis sp.]|nr:Hsp20/alpha crystallin family protein [Desulfofustis sp.]